MRLFKMIACSVLLLCGIVFSSSAQNIYINFKNGNHTQMALSDVRSITFSGDTMQLKKTDGTSFNWLAATIGNFNYKGMVYGIEDPSYSALNDVLLYPNPCQGSLSIRYHLVDNGKVKIDILDMSGRMIRQVSEEQKTPGNYELRWNGQDEKNTSVPAGTYFCRIVTGTTVITKKIIVIS